MSYSKNTSELKQEVLEICGELTNGSSPYEDRVITYLNDLHQGVIAGGNEFGVDIAEPWTWAQAKRPIVMNLEPAVTGSATLVQDSTSGTFSVAPSESLVGRYFRVESRADIYRIVAHTAGNTAFSLDQPYLDDGGTLNYTAYKLDYDVVDDTIVIDSSNNNIDFGISPGSATTVSITAGVYTPSSLATAIGSAMTTAIGSIRTITCTYSSLTRKFTIGTDGTYLGLNFSSGANARFSISSVIGYDVEDYVSETTTYDPGVINNTIPGVYSLSGLTRFTKPITTYREAPTWAQSARDTGKIFMIDDNTFLREYPLNRMRLDVPDKFCQIESLPNGIAKIRFNASVNPDPIRIEVNYIPVARKLTNSINSIPLIPGSYLKYLVYGAAFYILSDKSDSKAEQYATLAKAKLLAMVNDNRKGVSLAGNNFGRLIPRKGYSRVWGWGK